MPFIGHFEKVPCVEIKKRLGKPNLFGWIMFGWSEFGDSHAESGVYQQRRHRKWDGNGHFIISQERLNFIQKPAWPVQPPSAKRDAQQAKFTTALRAWQALTADEKRAINKTACRMSRRGYDYFMSRQLKK